MLPKPPSLKRPRLVEDILCHPLRERLPALLHTTHKSHAGASQSNSLANMGVKHTASRHRENLTSKLSSIGVSHLVYHHLEHRQNTSKGEG